MKKLIAIMVCGLAISGALMAQAAGKGSSDVKIFALEMGSGFNYDLGTSSSSATQTFTAVFGFSDLLQGGFTVITGDMNEHNFALMKLAVYPVQDVSIQLLFGSDGNSDPVSGFGFGYNILKNANPGLTTVLQLNGQYLFTDIAEGNLGLGLNLKIGL